jgi:hypothetical protein
MALRFKRGRKRTAIYTRFYTRLRADFINTLNQIDHSFRSLIIMTCLCMLLQ